MLTFNVVVQLKVARIAFINTDAYDNILLTQGCRINPCSVPIAELLAVWYGLTTAAHIFNNQMLYVSEVSLTVIH